MAAVLACGPGAVLSHASAAGLFDIRPDSVLIEVSVPGANKRRVPGVKVHRRRNLSGVGTFRGIPTTSPALTLIDLATQLGDIALERAVDQADANNVITVLALRDALDHQTRRPGLARLRALIDKRTFTLTDSVLERLFLRIAQQAGLPRPLTRKHVNGHRTDFHWPDLKLVVETDSLRYHRTPAQQTRDHLRDQAHLANGLTPARFTHAQVRYDAAHVVRTLRAIAQHLS
jgi:very-short-patch-repair endonuclease